LPYYVFPNLHKLGPTNNIDINEFEKDLKILEKKISEIGDISSANVQDVHEKISRILDIRDISFFQNLGVIGAGKDVDVVINLKDSARASISKALSLAIEKNYKSAYESDPDFRKMANDFF